MNHPLASYTSSGQLRCIACSTIVKHASSWEGHVGSKAHRMNAARLREKEQKRAVLAQREQQENEAAVHAKRKAEENEGPELPRVESKKRRLGSEEVRPQPTAKVSNGFPADFFSDPSKAPPLPSDDEEGDEEGNTAPLPAPAPEPSVVDLEWEKFQQEVLNPPDQQETFQRATVIAEPVLNPDIPEGFPPREGDVPEAEPEEELTEELKRQRKEQDERELIMDRLMEEERAQEEADAKVAMLKTRLEALRKQRETKKAAKAKKGE